MLNDHQPPAETGKTPDFFNWAFAAALVGPPDGAVEVNVSTTGTADPFKFTVVGFIVRVMPLGIWIVLNVTGLGIFDNGLTFIVAVTVWPAVIVIAVLFDKLKSGIFTLMKSPDVVAAA
jgi:hypothetical protein